MWKRPSNTVDSFVAEMFIFWLTIFLSLEISDQYKAHVIESIESFFLETDWYAIFGADINIGEWKSYVAKLNNIHNIFAKSLTWGYKTFVTDMLGP